MANVKNPRLTASDGWLLAALTESSRDGRPVTLRWFIHDADWLNRAIPTFDEISYGMPRLVAAGYVTVDGLSFRATPKATKLRELVDAGTVTLGGVIVGMERAVEALGDASQEPEDRSLGRLPGFSPGDLAAAVHEHGAWVERWSRVVVLPAVAAMRLGTAIGSVLVRIRDRRAR